MNHRDTEAYRPWAESGTTAALRELYCAASTVQDRIEEEYALLEDVGRVGAWAMEVVLVGLLLVVAAVVMWAVVG